MHACIVWASEQVSELFTYMFKLGDSTTYVAPACAAWNEGGDHLGDGQLRLTASSESSPLFFIPSTIEVLLVFYIHRGGATQGYRAR